MSIKSKPIVLILILGIMVLGSKFFATEAFSTENYQKSEAADSARSSTILKPSEPMDFMPSPVPDIMPLKIESVTPGQPLENKSRPSQEELNRLIQEEQTKPLSETPLVNYVQLDIMPVDIKTVALNSNSIVIARVTQIHDSQWSTEDGKRPKYLHHENGSYYIYTRTEVKVEQTIKGDVKLREILTLIKNGGRVGDDILEIDDSYPKFIQNQLLLLFIDPVSVPEIKGSYWRVNEQYNVEEATNIASNPFQQRLIEQLVSEIHEAEKLRLK